MGLPNLTAEEEYLLRKFALLKKRKKALQKSKEKVENPSSIKPGTKRDAPAEISHAPQDAKEIAKKLIASGEVKIKKDPVHREFKRAKGGERRQKDFLQQPTFNRNEQQARAIAMKSLYESFVPSSTSQNRRFSGGQGSDRRSWSDDQSRKGNTIFVKGYGLTEKILQEDFTKFGKVQNVNFEREKSQGFVTLDSCEAAEKAIDEMNGMMVSGVHIKVALSWRQPNMGDTQGHRRPGLGSRDSRGHSSGLQSREAREIVSYDDL
ncbi:negative elongation factor E-like isoform X2 [Stylophora pistillata]|uniref:negative elongation factor E-like isoform X2 n=1 Tax=Stylophora pistillata TaxID=50429 RepID=UPI000C04DD21|nr:negative elongation factor E-like isoform X2 [Stylophora pistillata]